MKNNKPGKGGQRVPELGYGCLTQQGKVTLGPEGGRELVMWTGGRREFQEEGTEDTETLWWESLGCVEEVRRRPNVAADY